MAKIIFYGGKGGVGKTTCSTANSINYANKGLKTLLISTDPAHSISDVLEMKIGKKITKIRENLDGLEIDPEYEAELYINRIRENMRTILSNVIVDEINSQLDAAIVSPGTYESALFDKIAEIIIEKFNIPVETLVINRILPEEIDKEFWLKKKKQEQKYMKDIEKEFSGKTLIKIPLLDSDMNKNTIDRLAEYFII